MSCNCCCVNTLNYCSQDVCGELDLGITAQMPGAHKLVLYFLGTKVEIEKEFDAAEQLVFPLNNLNEAYQYSGEMYDPIGNRIAITKNAIAYDCIRFSTTVSKKYSSVVLTS